VRESDNPKKKIRLVSLGAGYDLQSIKFAERRLVQQTMEALSVASAGGEAAVVAIQAAAQTPAVD